MDFKSSLIDVVSCHSQILSIESIIKDVEEFQRMDQLDVLERLRLENYSLSGQIMNYQSHWCQTLEMAQAARNALITLQDALNKCLCEEVAVEISWFKNYGGMPNLDNWI